MRRLFSGFAAAALFVLLLTPAVASADVNNFTITDFHASYYLDRSDPQGALTIEEKINVAFTDYNHGILRALPQKYNGQPQHVHVEGVMRDGTNEPYSTSTSNGNLVLKIGNANQTITGNHLYDIKYSVKNVIRFVGGHDELDWNTNGTEWQQPFLHVTAEVSGTRDLINKQTNLVCYTGGQGSTGHDCTVNTRGDTTTFTTVRMLQPGENMTFRADFPIGTFAKPTFKDWLDDHGAQLALAAGIPLAVLIVSYAYWRKNGKDVKGRGTIIPEYTPPEGLGPLEVDTIAHYKLGTKAISATLIDLAIRKYLRIIESDTKKLLGTKKTYSLELLNDDLSGLNNYELQIITAVFGGQKIVVDLSGLKNKFYTTAQALQRQLPDDLTKAGYFPRNPKRAGNGMHVVGGIMVFGGFYLFSASWALAVGVITSGIILFVFATLMPRRTQKGADAKDSIDGLKLYMNVAEKDRIKMLQSPNSPYADKTAGPAQTVELFEKLLPYAIVLGVEQQWAKQFESIYTTPPDWYSGNWTAFNAGYLVGSLNDSMGAMTTSFAAPSSSGSGSGGGFSGGGGGGGGGGGW